MLTEGDIKETTIYEGKKQQVIHFTRPQQLPPQHMSSQWRQTRSHSGLVQLVPTGSPDISETNDNIADTV